MFSADSGRLGTTLHLDDDIYEAVLSAVGHRAFQRRQDVLGARQAGPQPRPRSGGHAWRLPPAFDVPADAAHLWDGLPCSLVALGFVRVFARISATAAFLPSCRTSAIVFRQPTMARQASLEVSGESSSATAASASWTAITHDAVRTREGRRPRDPAEQARPPAGAGGVAQLVPQVVEVLTNAHLDVDRCK